MVESPRIETARLVLRRFEARDRAPFHALNVDPEVRAHFPGALTRAESDAFVDRINASIEQRGFGFFCAADRKTDECLGMIGLAVPSFVADNNQIVWAIHIAGDIPRWPDLEDVFALYVVTAKHRRAQREVA